MAQLAEQLICNQQVIGSSPIIGFYGWVPEWPKGADCKSVSNAFDGSNPSPSTYLREVLHDEKILDYNSKVIKHLGNPLSKIKAPSTSGLSHHPFTAVTRVRFP